MHVARYHVIHELPLPYIDNHITYIDTFWRYPFSLWRHDYRGDYAADRHQRRTRRRKAHDTPILGGPKNGEPTTFIAVVARIACIARIACNDCNDAMTRILQ
jgi:hypothetical protein